MTEIGHSVAYLIQCTTLHRKEQQVLQEELQVFLALSRFCEAERWYNKIFGQVVNFAYHSHQHHLLHEIEHVVSVSFQILAFTTGMRQVSAVLVAHQETRAGNIDHNWCKASVDVLKSHRITNFDHYMHSESMPLKWQRDCFRKMDS